MYLNNNKTDSLFSVLSDNNFYRIIVRLNNNKQEYSMPRMKILNSMESESYDKPPKLNTVQRKKFLSFPKDILEYANTMRSSSNALGFLLTFGYFRFTGKFYLVTDYFSNDADFVCRSTFEGQDIRLEEYSTSVKGRHEQFILKYFGCSRFNKNIDFISDEISIMVNNQLKPQLIFYRCIDLLRQSKIALPTYSRLSILILEILNQYKSDLSAIIQNAIPEETKTLLDNLFVQEADSRTSRYRLTLLKKISQSCKPTKVKERIEDLNFISDLYNKIQPILEAVEERKLIMGDDRDTGKAWVADQKEVMIYLAAEMLQDKEVDSPHITRGTGPPT